MEYKGINVSDKVKLFNKNGEYNSRIAVGLDNLIEAATERSHKIVGVYKSNSEKIAIECENSHSFSVSPNSYKSGVGCSKCSGKCSAQAEKEFLQLLHENDHRLLEQYNGCQKKVSIKFECGHKRKLKPVLYKNGHRCKVCKKN